MKLLVCFQVLKQMRRISVRTKLVGVCSKFAESKLLTFIEVLAGNHSGGFRLY